MAPWHQCTMVPDDQSWNPSGYLNGPNNDGLICPIHKCCWLMIDRMLDLNIGHGNIYIWEKMYINLYFMQTHSMDLWIYIYYIYIQYIYINRFHVKILGCPQISSNSSSLSADSCSTEISPVCWRLWGTCQPGNGLGDYKGVIWRL